MSSAPAHDRSYMQSRLREEIARSRRYARKFCLLVFEEVPSADGLPQRQKMERGLVALASAVRDYDVVGRVHDDTIAVLLIEAEPQGVRDALIRIRARLSRDAGTWRVTAYHFPEHAEAIDVLPLVTAA